ncbi:pyridoxal phosphate-dependent transferase [Xylogone sp. PMI_703]|nr:pyridoxal phosphate-dependent transferase [Xylogone sp. PMI_703]
MESPQATAAKYHLSQRAAENLVHGDHWEPIERALENAWDKENNPNGIINLGIAENSLMHDESSKYLKENFQVQPKLHLTYGTGPRGSHRLQNAVSEYLNSHFHARIPVTPKQVLPISGVGTLTDALTWSICSNGEGILIPQPLYTGFQVDIPTRSRGVIVPVPFSSVEGYSSLNDVFDAKINEIVLERAYQESEKKGIKIRAVMVVNPHNPLGKCYPVDTLKAIASFCGKHSLHMLCDEIYAQSVFENPSAPQATPFTSILALDLEDRIDPNLVQVLYGPSKDFGANGLRLAILCSRNEGLIGAVASLTVFDWPPYVLQDLWAHLLEDQEFLDWFLAENKRRLSENYNLITSFLSSNGIGYFSGGNAGVFLWVDLREYVKGDRATEALLVKKCVERGLFVGYGTNFFSEEVGWFRLTFTAKTEILMEGLKRLVSVLEDMKNAAAKN